MSEAVSLETEESTNKGGFLSQVRKKVDHLTTLFLDFVSPKNCVTGTRQFRIVPLFVETFVGASLYHSYILKSGGPVTLSYQRYEEVVQRVGKALTAKAPRGGMDFEFTVVNDSTLDAWCLPGGKIVVNLGLMKALEEDRNAHGCTYNPTFEEKVAAVLSHAITHATLAVGKNSEC